MLPAWKGTFFSSSSLPLPEPPPSAAASQSSRRGSLSHFLSGRSDTSERHAATVRRRGLCRRPRGRGATTREQACIIKTGQAANQSPGIWFKNLAWGATTDHTLERRVKLLSICLLITLLTSRYSGEVTQKHGRTWAAPQNFFKNPEPSKQTVIAG